jgi:hypothetical protein
MQSTNGASPGRNYSRRSSTSYRIRTYEAHTLGPNTSSIDPDPNSDPDSITKAKANAEADRRANTEANSDPNSFTNVNANAILNADTRSYSQSDAGRYCGHQG